MLTCKELVELVTDYLEGALSAELGHRVRRHLSDCADCLRYLAQIEATRRLLRRLAEPSDPSLLESGRSRLIAEVRRRRASS